MGDSHLQILIPQYKDFITKIVPDLHGFTYNLKPYFQFPKMSAYTRNDDPFGRFHFNCALQKIVTQIVFYLPTEEVM